MSNLLTSQNHFEVLPQKIKSFVQLWFTAFLPQSDEPSRSFIYGSFRLIGYIVAFPELEVNHCVGSA